MSTARFYKSETKSKVVNLEVTNLGSDGFEVPDSFRRRYNRVVTEFWRLQDELRGYRRGQKKGQPVEIPEQDRVYLTLATGEVERIIEMLSERQKGRMWFTVNTVGGDSYHHGKSEDEILAEAKEAAAEARRLSTTIHVLERAMGVRE